MLSEPEVISVHRLLPLFMGGDIKIGMAYVISDFLHAVVQRFPGKKGRWMGRVESSSETELSDQER
jgi:hypothetical protein